MTGIPILFFQYERCDSQMYRRDTCISTGYYGTAGVFDCFCPPFSSSHESNLLPEVKRKEEVVSDASLTALLR